MIHVRLKGKLGNNIFQYCLGRLLASRMGYEMLTEFTHHSRIEQWSFIPGLHDKVGGQSYNDPVEIINDTHPDPLKTVSNARKIVIDGFFQQSRFYIPYRDEIRNWLQINPIRPFTNVLSVHVRLIHKGRGVESLLPFSYYEDAIKSSSFDHIMVVTDSPNDPIIHRFLKYRPLITSSVDDFRLLMGSTKIVLSQSTYAWWAAFLSDADDIVFPVPQTGFWSGQFPFIDLRVNEPRYRYLPVKPD